MLDPVALPPDGWHDTAANNGGDTRVTEWLSRPGKELWWYLLRQAFLLILWLPTHRTIWGSRYWCIANNNKKAHHAWPKAWMNPAFVDWPATHGRLLFWWSAKQQINGMLFWDVNTFMNQPGRSAVQRIDDTMLTDFNPATSFFDADSQPNAPPLSWSDGTNTNGDGSLTYPGVDGPLSSIRLENIRDGIEVRQRCLFDMSRFPLADLESITFAGLGAVSPPWLCASAAAHP